MNERITGYDLQKMKFLWPLFDRYPADQAQCVKNPLLGHKITKIRSGSRQTEILVIKNEVHKKYIS